MDLITTHEEAFTQEERQAIEAQLERLLANPFFSHSRRFPSFLRYVVDKTLSGEAEYLKERTLGIEIFGKGADYDTATDPIVRVTAAEIRKRIAQYYQEPGHQQELRLSLPPGSYIPQFHPAEPEALPQEVHSPPVPSLPVQPEASSLAEHHSSSVLFWKLASAILLLVAIGSLMAWRWGRRPNIPEFWAPVLSSSEPVLFCVADQPEYRNIALRDAANPSHVVTLQDTVTAVVLDDLSTITKIAGVLQTAGKQYTVRGESQTTLMDLRGGPSIIIGAFDNAWTLRLLQPLRFHFANDPEMTKFSILDTQAGKVIGTVDRTQQMATNNYTDYAIVARFMDNTTGKPTIIAAGIGRGGTIAAGEFLTSPALQQAVRSQQRGNHENVEVVLSTQIINGEPGTPTIEFVHFW